jgi:hypothetical protein
MKLDPGIHIGMHLVCFSKTRCDRDWRDLLKGIQCVGDPHNTYKSLSLLLKRMKRRQNPVLLSIRSHGSAAHPRVCLPHAPRTTPLSRPASTAIRNPFSPFHFESNRRCLPLHLLRHFPTSPTAMAAAVPPASSSPPPPSAADEDGVEGAVAAAVFPASSSPPPPIAADVDDDEIGGAAVRCSSPTPAPHRRTSPNRSGGSSRKVSSLARSLPFDLAAASSRRLQHFRFVGFGGVFTRLLLAVVGGIEFTRRERCGFGLGFLVCSKEKNLGGVPAAGSE